MKKLGLYIHIPFCKKKCVYCDFLSFECDDFLVQNKYVDAILNEVELKCREYAGYSVDTIFIGGGTPSILQEGQIERIIKKVRESFRMCENAEITIESNPGTLTREKLTEYRRVGINRLSVGVQSFDDELLKLIGRIHTVEDVRDSLREARNAGFDNINIDLMFSIPGHSKEKWHATLEKAVEMDPQHISFYSLQLEEGTPLFEAFKQGKFNPASDEEDREMYHYGINFLKEAGYQHYEISNAAKPQGECKHNMKYWSMQDYLGIGIGAHSFMRGIRFSNTSDIREYIAESGGCGYKTYTVNSIRDDAGEFMFTGLRKVEGIDLSEFEQRLGTSFFDFYAPEQDEINEYINNGFLELRGDKMRLTEKGIDISNDIMAVFV
ncbi:MAG: radical SAM family heme chaperone HemW [Eubacteriales bacterium]|nr:radical SAM family heme chaperone HemW [Eubacteriales bacterium]